MKYESHVEKGDGFEITYKDGAETKVEFVPFKKTGKTEKLRQVLRAELIRLLPKGLQNKFNS